MRGNKKKRGGQHAFRVRACPAIIKTDVEALAQKTSSTRFSFKKRFWLGDKTYLSTLNVFRRR